MQFSQVTFICLPHLYFSMEKLAKYDIPAHLSMVNNVTKAAPNIAFIGQSLGGSDAILYPTLYPEGAEKMLKVSIAVAPGTQFKYTWVPFFNVLSWLAEPILVHH